MPYSVLMSVYYKEQAEYLRCAMDSIWNQTVATDDFVLVCDGPLTPELDVVIREMQAAHADSLQLVRLEKNGGLGNALNIGLTYCRHDLVARMDSDDLSRPDRCEKQLRVFEQDPELAVCSGIVEEFSDTPEKTDARRVLPEKQEEIFAFAGQRNPFNHPCVMYRKSAVLEAGSYQDFYLLEDYYLWIRMLNNKCRGYNLQEPLLYMRAGSGMYRRRSGLRYARSQRALFRYMEKIGFISRTQCLKSCITRTIASLIPNGLRKALFQILLRK